MKYGNCIRSDVGHMNRESRRQHKKRIQDEQFGIYRPLCPETAEELRDILIPAKEKAQRFLSRHRSESADLVVPADLGVTFVMRQRVQRAMARGLLLRGFEFNQMMRRIECEVDLKDQTLDVARGGLDWFSTHNRKLVTTFDDHRAEVQLEEERDVVANVLEDVHAGKVPVVRPDHVTLMKYGRDGDRLDLSRRHQEAVADIIDEHLDDAGFDSLRLGGLVVGTSYSQPFVNQPRVA